MLRWKRNAVDLVGQERVALEELSDRKAALVRLLLLTLDTAIESGEHRFDRVVAHTGFVEQVGYTHPAPPSGSDGFEEPGLAHDVRLDERTAVAGALHRHGSLEGRPSTKVVQRQRDGPLDEPADLEAPRVRIDVRECRSGSGGSGARRA